MSDFKTRMQEARAARDNLAVLLHESDVYVKGVSVRLYGDGLGLYVEPHPRIKYAWIPEEFEEFRVVWGETV